MTAFADSELLDDALARARAGERRAHADIYRLLERPVRTLASRLVSRAHVAEDLAQDVFVEVLTSIGQYDGRGSFAGWVRTITVRKCLMHLRSPWRRGLQWIDCLGGEEPCEPRACVPNPGGEAVDLERALAQLPDTARAVVWLHDVEGYTHGEIGALLGGTASLSKSRLARAHARLRDLLENDGAKTSCMPVSTNC
jgi:DNA-directed RNA polymerase specialized sigma24 family protein